MSALSDYAESQLGSALLKGGSYSGSAVYVALFTSNPTDADGAGEVSDTAYARQRAHSSVVSDGFTEGPNGTFKNANVLEFPAMAGPGAVTVTHFAVYDASTGGNLLLHAPASTTKTYDPGDIPRFPVGGVTVTLD